MKRITFFSVVYITLLILGGSMRVIYGENLLALFEIGLALALFLSLYFLHNKKFLNIVIFALALVLAFYFWYFFYTTTGFYFGIMGAISGFFSFLYGVEVFKVYTKPPGD